MSSEIPNYIEVKQLKKATAEFYLRSEDYEDVVVATDKINVRREKPSWVDIDGSFSHIRFDISVKPEPTTGSERLILHVRTLKNILTETGFRQQRDFVGQDKDVNYFLHDFPVRIVDQETREQILISTDIDESPSEENPIGVKPEDPEPTLSASVALKSHLKQRELGGVLLERDLSSGQYNQVGEDPTVKS